MEMIYTEYVHFDIHYKARPERQTSLEAAEAYLDRYFYIKEYAFTIRRVWNDKHNFYTTLILIHSETENDRVREERAEEDRANYYTTLKEQAGNTYY